MFNVVMITIDSLRAELEKEKEKPIKEKFKQLKEKLSLTTSDLKNNQKFQEALWICSRQW